MKTVSQLITELEVVKDTLGDLPVLVYGYEEDYDAITNSKIVRVADKGEREKERYWWSGRYETRPATVRCGGDRGMKPITELTIGHVGTTIHVTDDGLDVTGTLNHLKVRAWKGVVHVDVETIRGDLTAHYFEMTLHISGNTIRPTLNAQWEEVG